MPSFDIVNEVDLQEIDNAVNITKKVIETRFDFRGSDTEIELDKKGKKISVVTADTMKMDGIKDLLAGNFVKRKVSPKCMDYGEVEPTSKGAVKLEIKLKEGIDHDMAKKITKLIKESGLKVQAAIQDEQVRVTGKKIDDLQAVIAAVKAANLEIPLQYVNMKS